MKQEQNRVKDELNFNFFIQTVRVEDEIQYDRVVVKARVQENELRYSIADSDAELKTVLTQIKRLYDLYRTNDNGNIVKGVREEIVKLVALILWNFYRK